jgi:hypothetical protein
MRRAIVSLFGLVICLSGAPWGSGRADELDSEFVPELVAVDMTARDVRPGDPISVTFTFRNAGTRPARHDYRVFTHLEAPEKSCENIVVHADHEASEPTTLWQPGQAVLDGPHLIRLPADAQEGEYFLHVGLFDYGRTGRRLLDVYAPTTIRVSRAAPDTTQSGPARLAAAELAKRRQAIASRIDSIDRESLDDYDWAFDVDRTSGAWALIDKETGVQWTSCPAQPRFGRVTLRQGDRRVVCPIDQFDEVAATERSMRLIASLEVDGAPSGVTVVFTIRPSTDFDGLQLTYVTHAAGPWQVASVRFLEEAFHTTEEDGGAVYVPHRLGMEIAADQGLPGQRVWVPYNDLTMAMCGVVKRGSALLISWDQVDSRMTTHATWPDLPLVAGRRAVSVSLEFDAVEGLCIIQPLGKGGYVEIAKAYRPIAEAKGWRRTWADKRANYPSVDRLFGAANFKPFVFSRVLPSSRFSPDGKEHVHVNFTFAEVAQCAEHWRDDLEIDRAMVVLAGWINGGYDVRHPDVLPAAPECGGDEALTAAAARIRDCGYLFGLHDNYQDMYEDAASWDVQWLNKDAEGRPRAGGNWNGGQAWQVCAIKQVELAAREETNLPEIARLFEPTVYFIDTVFAWPLVTCEDPAHPMSRRDDLIWKTRLCMLAKSHFGLFGSEEGREWAVPCADYLEGLLDHQTESAPGQVVPLFPIVYSDCVQIMNHQGTRIGPGDEKRVADHILLAEMFLPRFGSRRYWRRNEAASPGADPVADGQLWARGDNGWGSHLSPTDRVIKNVWEVLSPLNRITAESPLDEHRFLTEDRLLQQTRFGDVTITVAYEQPARVGDHMLPPTDSWSTAPGSSPSARRVTTGWITSRQHSSRLAAWTVNRWSNPDGCESITASAIRAFELPARN